MSVASKTEGAPLPIRVPLTLLTMLFPNLMLPAATLRYAPNETMLTGRIVRGQFQQPDGRWDWHTLLKLEHAVDVEADCEVPLNVTEVCIYEIQLLPQNAEVARALTAARECIVEVAGEIFHGYHERHPSLIIMTVSGLRVTSHSCASR
jgi:hypothetical protein